MSGDGTARIKILVMYSFLSAHCIHKLSAWVHFGSQDAMIY